MVAASVRKGGGAAIPPEQPIPPFQLSLHFFLIEDNSFGQIVQITFSAFPGVAVGHVGFLGRWGCGLSNLPLVADGRIPGVSPTGRKKDQSSDHEHGYVFFPDHIQ